MKGIVFSDWFTCSEAGTCAFLYTLTVLLTGYQYPQIEWLTAFALITAGLINDTVNYASIHQMR